MECRTDRRTFIAGASATVAGVAAAGPAALAAPRFDPALARRLERILRDGHRDPRTRAPGAILHVRDADGGAFSAAAGRARLAPAMPMRPGDRFRTGSIAKAFVAVVVLQLVEERRLRLDAPLTEVLAPAVAAAIPGAGAITVRMLLGHRSGVPEWMTPAVEAEIVQRPAKVWTAREVLASALAQPPAFAPGAGFSYSNTNSTLLGLAIERAAFRSWRDEVRRRVVRPLRLQGTTLPSPGRPEIGGRHARGYELLGGRRVDVTGVDPSMAGAGGGGALVSTASDLGRFLDALLAGRLFRRRETLRRMLAFGPATGEGGVTGYGLGLERRVLAGCTLVGHLGTTAGYRSVVARIAPGGATIVVALNAPGDPRPVLVPAIRALA